MTDEPFGPDFPEQTVIALREWGERHTFLDDEAEDSFDRGIGNIQWALAVESAMARDKPEAEPPDS